MIPLEVVLGGMTQIGFLVILVKAIGLVFIATQTTRKLSNCKIQNNKKSEFKKLIPIMQGPSRQQYEF